MTDRVLRVARAHRNATGCEFPAAVEVAIALIEEEVA
jgi:hypothetical protein